MGTMANCCGFRKLAKSQGRSRFKFLPYAPLQAVRVIDHFALRIDLHGRPLFPWCRPANSGCPFAAGWPVLRKGAPHLAHVVRGLHAARDR